MCIEHIFNRFHRSKSTLEQLTCTVIISQVFVSQCTGGVVSGGWRGAVGVGSVHSVQVTWIIELHSYCYC